MFVFSMVAFHYIFFNRYINVVSQRPHQISQLLWTAGSTSKSWSIRPWYRNQPTNMVHQDHFTFSFLSTRCSSENITEDMGRQYNAQICLGSIFEKNEWRMARIHPIRWVALIILILPDICLVLMNWVFSLGYCAAECERGFSWNPTRWTRNPIRRPNFKLFFHYY